jgi:hypothetical protein
MSKKSLLSLHSKAQLGNFNAMACFLSELHFEEFPPERRQLEHRAMGLTYTENYRQEEAENGVSFRKYFREDYFIEVHTTFNKSSEKFNETGYVGVLIKYSVQGKGLSKVFQCYFERVEGLTDRIHALVYALNIAMMNRPYSKYDGTLMPLKDFSTKTKKLDSRFKGLDDFDLEEISIFDEKFLQKMPTHLFNVLEEVLQQREYYYSHKDPNSRSIEDIKRVREPQKPGAIVPSHNP